MKRILSVLTILSILVMTGCTMTPGTRASADGAAYRLNKTTADGDTCSVDISSQRVMSAASIEIGPDCSVKAMAENVQSSDAALKAMSQALDVLSNIAK